MSTKNERANRYQALREAQRLDVAAWFLRRRPALTFTIATINVALLLAAHYAWSRILVVVGAYFTYLVYQIGDWLWHRTHPIRDRTLFLAGLVTLAFMGINTGASGGLASPLAVSILPVTVGSLVAYGRSRESWLAAGWASLLVIVLALLPASVVGPRPAAPYDVALTLAALLFGIYVLLSSMMRLSDAMSSVEDKLDRMREDVLVGAEQRGQTLESIGAKVAHELKNPLASIKGLAQLLERGLGEGPGDARARERLAVVRSEITRMETILRDYLSFERPLTDLRREPVELAPLVDDVFAVLEARAATAKVTLRRRGEALASADPRRLKEALLNLLANALEASSSGAGSTATSTTVDVDIETSADAGRVVVRVRDHGRGIGKEDLARIGTPFFTTREGGTGLGVCLARAVVTQHGGELRYDSALGAGTTATLTLPKVA